MLSGRVRCVRCVIAPCFPSHSAPCSVLVIAFSGAGVYCGASREFTVNSQDGRLAGEQMVKTETSTHWDCLYCPPLLTRLGILHSSHHWDVPTTTTTATTWYNNYIIITQNKYSIFYQFIYYFPHFSWNLKSTYYTLHKTKRADIYFYQYHFFW